jgi:uncharacterized membrane protein YhaH (DUF805 family)
VEHFIYGYKNFKNFSGRTTRTQFWVFFLIAVLAAIPSLVIDYLSFGGPFLSAIYYLTTLIPMPSIIVRRLHDIGRSGWWLALSLPLLTPMPPTLSFVSFFTLAALCLIESDGDNQWGPNTLHLAQS